jgi:hypothetical protein
LEIDRHVEACDHHVRAEEEVCHATGPDNPLTEHRQRNHGLVTLSVLPQQEATSAPADPQNNPMTIALLHLYVVPPHSIASRNMIAADAKMVKPGISKERRMEGGLICISDLGRRSGI